MPINLFQPRERGKLFPAKSREVGERLAALGYDAAANSPEQLAEHVKVELARYGRLIRAIGFCDKAGPE